MSKRKGTPELTWQGKGARRREGVRPRLVEVPALSHRARGSAEPAFAADNFIVQGDNLEALEALEPSCAGTVRLVYIDPPFNTGSTFDHYDDGLDHDAWLEAMRERLVALRRFLRPDGVFVAQIDKVEQAYLKVLLDEVFGREAYITTVAVRMSATSGFKLEHTDKTLVKNTEYLHIYAAALTLHGKVYERASYDPHYSLEIIETPQGRTHRRLVEHAEVARLLAAHGLGRTAQDLATLYERSLDFRDFVAAHRDVIARTHTAPAPAKQAHERGELFAPERPDEVVRRTYGGTTYLLRRTRTGVDQLIPIGLKLNAVEVVGGPDEVVLTNIAGDWWDGFHLDMGNVENEGAVAFRNGKKPERLLRRIINLFTEPGDLVLDAFAGSGTTPAVAHKMGRRWVALERGPQAVTHIRERLAAIVDGRDPSGVTASTAWRGGGGFRFLTLNAEV